MVQAALAVLVACAPDARGPGSTEAPRDSGVEATLFETVDLTAPAPETPLVPWLEVALVEPALLDVRWDSADHGAATRAESARTHRLPLVEVRPGRDYTVTVTATAEDGRTDTHTVPMRSAELPLSWPRLEVEAHDPEGMEPGYTLFDLSFASLIDQYLVVLDADLEVVWLYVGPDWLDIRHTSRGTLLGTRAGGVTEMDFTGAILRRYTDHAGPGELAVPYAKLHHEAYELADQRILTLGERWVTVPDYPTSAEDPSSTASALVTVPVLLILGADGGVEDSRDVVSKLDLYRVGFDSVDPGSPIQDWGHANAVVPHADGGAIASLRHQDAVVKLTADGELDWILGDPAGWEAPLDAALLRPAPGAPHPFPWPYHQHAVEWTDDGRLLLFDNHNYGFTPWTPALDPKPGSRVLEFLVDEDVGTVALGGLWDGFGVDGRIIAPRHGDADALPVTGNILATFGFVLGEGGVANPDAGLGYVSARVVEFSRTDPSAPVLDLRITTDDAADPYGAWAYRAERIPFLLP